MRAVILAAGLGSRLRAVTGGAPKPLTLLPDGRSILAQQLDNLAAFGFRGSDVTVVVGYRADDVVEACPDARHVYNEDYDKTNTAASLLRALKRIPAGEDVLWMNGDVVFDPLILGRALPLMQVGQSFVAVNTVRVADEEVKYTLDADGYIRDLAKVSPYPGVQWLGEAVGINFLAASDGPCVTRRLTEAAAQDYFERGLERAIALDGLRLSALDITGLRAIEVDSPEDLEKAFASYM